MYSTIKYECKVTHSDIVKAMFENLYCDVVCISYMA